MNFKGIRKKSSTAAVDVVTKPVSATVYPPVWKQLGPNYAFVRVAALSGASAVCLAAYGRHQMKEVPREIRDIYESASNIHLIHSVALLAVPIAKRPAIVSFEQH